MRRVLRSILALFVGILAAFITITAVQALGHHLYPTPPGLDFNKRDALVRYMAEVPTGALLCVLLSYALGALLGTGLAALLAPAAPLAHALAIGSLLLGLTVINLMMIPHPLWFCILNLALYLPIALLGVRLAQLGRGKELPIPP